MLKYIFKISIFLLTAIPAFCQEKGKYIPKSFSVGFDAGNFLYSRIIDDVDFREYTADIQINKLLLVADYGYSLFEQNEAYHNYTAEGNYFRAGIDYNFIKKTNNPNIIFVGIRYGHSWFDEMLNYSTTSGITGKGAWPENNFGASKENITGNWLELAGGIKVDVFKGFQLGFTGRYKFMSSVENKGNFSNYYLPGYGKRLLDRNSNWGISYYIGYRFRFRK